MATTKKQVNITVQTKDLKTKKKNVKKPEPPKRYNKTWEAFQRLKGCIIVNDPTFLV